MFLDFKVFVKYVLGCLNFFFLKFSSKDRSSLFFVLLSQRNLYFFFLHLRLSSRFFFYQLVDLFAYELATTFQLSASNLPKRDSSSTVLVYNFHGCKLQEKKAYLKLPRVPRALFILSREDLRRSSRSYQNKTRSEC